MKKENIKYFIIATLALYLTPSLITFAILAVSSNISAAHFFIIPALISAFAFAFGRLFPSWNKISEPESRTALYAPAFMPAIMLPVVCLLAEIFSKYEILQLILLLPNLWSIYFNALRYVEDLKITICSIYLPAFGFNVLYGLFFVWGERSAAKKWGIKRDKFKVKYIAVLAAYFAVFGGAVVYYDYYTELTTVTVDESEQDYYLDRWISSNASENTEGYGFTYEHGWSSVDLRPYYVENENNLLAKLDEPAAFRISEASEMPVLDGAEAAYPVYSAFANACYENIADIQEYAKSKEGKEENAPMPIRFTNTIEAYKSLVSGDVDIFFGAEPSAEQKKLAEEAGKELVYTPIGKEAFVFFVSEDNPVDGLILIFNKSPCKKPIKKV